MESTVSGDADAWRRRVEDQRAGGQSVRAWCLANGIREHSFYWWRARLGLSPRQRHGSQRERATGMPPGFARVVVDGAGLVLRLKQRELIFPASMPMEQVARLLRALEDRP